MVFLHGAEFIYLYRYAACCFTYHYWFDNKRPFLALLVAAAFQTNSHLKVTRLISNYSSLHNEVALQRE